MHNQSTYSGQDASQQGTSGQQDVTGQQGSGQQGMSGQQGSGQQNMPGQSSADQGHLNKGQQGEASGAANLNETGATGRNVNAQTSAQDQGDRSKEDPTRQRGNEPGQNAQKNDDPTRGSL